MAERPPVVGAVPPRPRDGGAKLPSVAPFAPGFLAPGSPRPRVTPAAASDGPSAQHCSTRLTPVAARLGICLVYGRPSPAPGVSAAAARWTRCRRRIRLDRPTARDALNAAEDVRLALTAGAATEALPFEMPASS